MRIDFGWSDWLIEAGLIVLSAWISDLTCACIYFHTCFTYLLTYLCTNLPTNLLYVRTYLSTYLPIYLLTYLLSVLTSLPTYLLGDRFALKSVLADVGWKWWIGHLVSGLTRQETSLIWSVLLSSFERFSSSLLIIRIITLIGFRAVGPRPGLCPGLG